MIYLFGDSHANFSFKNLKHPHRNLYQNSVTMFRIGRVVPPVSRITMERVYGFGAFNATRDNSFPIVGTDEERIRITSKVNKLIEEL